MVATIALGPLIRTRVSHVNTLSQTSGCGVLPSSQSYFEWPSSLNNS